MLSIKITAPEICIFFVCIAANTVVSQNRIANKVDFNQELINFQNLIWTNSALLYFYQDLSYSDISLQYGQEKANGLHRIEKGDETSDLNFDAFSFKKRKKSVVMGRASYKKSTSKNMIWNNVADYDLLAPYIVADTIGGTSMEELYAFEGAYCFKKGQNTYGVKALYRASEEYRKLDPRPKSTVSNLELNIGTSVAVQLKYRLGINVSYQNYQQDHSVKALRPGTGIKIFYLRGFGISDESFANVITDNSSAGHTYEQKGYSMGSQLLPITGNGFFNSVEYQHTKLELLDTNYDLISRLMCNKLGVEIGKEYFENNKTIKVKAYVNYYKKSGSEFNYNLNRLLLSVTEKYTNTIMDGGISFIVSNSKKKNHFFYQSTLGYRNNNSNYKAVIAGENPLQEVEKVYLELKGGGRYKFPESVLSIKFCTGYESCLHHQIITSDLAVQSVDKTLVIPDYQFLSSDQFQISSDIRYDIDTNKMYGIYFRAKQFTMLFKNSQPYWGFSMAIGLTF